MAALTDYQIQLGDDGVILGGVNPPVYKVEAFEGLERGMRGNDQSRPNADGSTLTPDYAEAKNILITLNIIGSSPADAMAKYDALAANWAKARGPEGAQVNIPLRWKLPGQVTRRLNVGRPRRIAPDLSGIRFSLVKAVATYYAPDPRVLADVERSVTLPYGGVNATLPNDGNHPAAVVYDVQGAVTNPGVIRSEAARFDLTVAIPISTFFRVRTDSRTVTRSTNSANEYPTFSGSWLEIPAGGALFRAVGTGTGAGVVVTYRDTWL